MTFEEIKERATAGELALMAFAFDEGVRSAEMETKQSLEKGRIKLKSNLGNFLKDNPPIFVQSPSTFRQLLSAEWLDRFNAAISQ